jgi:chorismate synthase
MDIYAVVTSIEDSRICLSQRELLGTWEENAALFAQGETVMGIVRSVEDYGIFVELTPNLAGLAEPREGVRVGQHAGVYIKNILAEKMKLKMAEVSAKGDSIGGIVEGCVIGAPVGVGEPWFDSVESVLSHLLFSIGGVKGVEFGDGFAITKKKGSEANDPFTVDHGRIVTTKNASGGIQGGITNGMPILVRVAVKPTPSIYTEQQSVDIPTMQSTSLTISGRHDGAIVHRTASVVRAMLAFGIADLLTVRYGTDALFKGIQK